MRHTDDGELQSWLDRDRSGLTPDEADAIEAHLENCAPCAARLEGLVALAERSRAILDGGSPAGAVPPDFAEVKMRARRGSGRSAHRREWVAAGWAASIVVAIGLGWMTNDLLRPGQGADPMTSRMAMQADPGLADSPASPQALAAPTDPPEVAPPSESPAESSPLPDEPAPREPAPREPAPRASDGGSVERSVLTPAVALMDTRDSTIVLGRVLDERGTPLASAQVSVAGGTVGTLTRADGSFALSFPRTAGDTTLRDVTLAAQFMGFRPETRALDLTSADTLTANFRLAQSAVALEELVVTGVAPAAPSPRMSLANQDEARARERAEGEGWRPLSRTGAEAAAGFGVVTIPELEILSSEFRDVNGTATVRIRQSIAPGVDLVLIQRAYPAPVEFMTIDGQPTLSRWVGNVIVTASAPVAPDSLAALLARVR